MSKLRTQKNLSITRFELTKRILVVAGLGSFLLLSLVVTRSSPRTGWFGVLLFGVMTILVVYELAKLRHHKLVKGDGIRANVRASLIWAGTIMLSIFFGVVAAILSRLALVRMPVMAIWLATFMSTLAFYPFRGEEAKDDIPTFVWIIYSALMGVVSVGFAALSTWLE